MKCRSVYSKASDKEQLEKLIKTKLKEIMMTVDLEEVTSKFVSSIGGSVSSSIYEITSVLTISLVLFVC